MGMRGLVDAVEPGNGDALAPAPPGITALPWASGLTLLLAGMCIRKVAYFLPSLCRLLFGKDNKRILLY